MKIGSVAKKLLCETLDGVCEICDLMLTPPGKRNTSSQYWIPREQWERMMSEPRHKRALISMRRKKWIVDRRKGNEMQHCLSYNFLVQALKEKIRLKNNLLPMGEMCLVLFDFPNAVGKARHAWRFFLSGSGFSKRQLSVWQTRKDVVNECKVLVRLLRIEKWVHVLTAKE